MYQGFRSEVDRLQEKIVLFTKELIRIPSPSLHEDQVAARVREEMRRLDFDLSFTDEVGNVIGVIAGGDPKCTFLLNSHMDTVHCGGLGSWSFYPLGGETSGDRIVGLGASDCKAGISAQAEQGSSSQGYARSMPPVRRRPGETGLVRDLQSSTRENLWWRVNRAGRMNTIEKERNHG